jgi:hypothetical protein
MLDLAESLLARHAPEAAISTIELIKSGHRTGERAAFLRKRCALALGSEMLDTGPRTQPPESLHAARMMAAASDALIRAGRTEAALDIIELLESGWTETDALLRFEVRLARIHAALASKNLEHTVKLTVRLDGEFPPGLITARKAETAMARFEISLATGDERAALREGRAAARDIERRIRANSMPALQGSIAAGHSGFINRLIDLELTAGDSRRAFELVQQSTARRLLQAGGRTDAKRIEQHLFASDGHPAKEDPGRRSLRRMTTTHSRKAQPLGWRGLIARLLKLKT